MLSRVLLMHRKFFTILFTLTMTASFGQSLSIEDFIVPFQQGKNFAVLREFLEARGFDYDSVALPGSIGKMYSFTATTEKAAIGINGEPVRLADIILLRMDSEVKVGKVTLMTPSIKYYEELVGRMKELNFKAREHQDKGKPMAYTSEAHPGVAISLSSTQAVKDGQVYNRYTIAVSF